MSKKLAQGFITITDSYETAMVKLTNEIVAIPCDSFGKPKLGGYLGASTFIEVFRGNDRVYTSDIVIGDLILSSGTKAEAVMNKIMITSVENMSGYVDVPVDINTSEGRRHLGTYRFGYIKQLDGAEAQSISIVGEQVFKYTDDFANGPTPSEIHLSAITQNMNSPTFQWLYKKIVNNEEQWILIGETNYGVAINAIDGSPILDSSSRRLYTSSGTIGISPTDAMWDGKNTLQLKCIADGNLYDEFTVYKVSDGKSGDDAYTVMLTNENHSFPAYADGSISENKNITTGIIAYKGTSPAVVSSVIIPSTKPQGLDISVSGSIVTITALKGSSLAENGTFNIGIVIDGKTFDRTFSWSKIKQGSTGADGKPGVDGKPGESSKYIIISGEQAFKKNKDSSIYTPQSITLTAQRFNVTESGKWYTVVNNIRTELGSATTQVIKPTDSLANGGLSSYMTGIVGYEIKTKVDGKDAVIRDEVTVVKLVDGDDGDSAITMLLTNENHSVPSAYNGVVAPADLANAKTDIKIFEGTKDVTGSWDVTVANGTGLTGSVSGTTTKTYTVTAFAQNNGSTMLTSSASTLTASRNGYPNMTKTFSITKSLKGQDGTNGTTTYTWIRYADTATGSGISNSPVGRKYIGFAYNKTSPTESNTPGDYKWSLMKGEDGVDGAPGKDGTTTYTWIKYSNVISPTQSNQIYDIPTASTVAIGIAVNKTTSTESTTPSDYTWSKFRGDDGVPGANGKPGTDGAPGISYTLNIIGGARGIAYSAIGDNPSPSTTGAYSVELLRNGERIEPNSYKWSYGGSIEPIPGVTQTDKSTFSAKPTNNIVTDEATFISVSVKPTKDEDPITQTIPIVCTKHADGLDWIKDWDGTKAVIDGEKVLAAKIYAGTVNAGKLSGVAIGTEALMDNTKKRVGIVGYKSNVPTFLLDTDGKLLLSTSGNSGAVVNGTSKGLYWDGANLSIAGKVKIMSGSTIGDSGETKIDDVVQGAVNGTDAKNGLDNLQIGGRNLLPGSNKEMKEVTFSGWDYYFPNDLKNWSPGEQITGRIYLKPISQEASCMLHVKYADGKYSQTRGVVIRAGSEGYSTVTTTIPNRQDITKVQFSIRHSSGSTPSNKVFYKEPKVEKGNKATDWTPTPEDVQSEIDDSRVVADNALNGVESVKSVAEEALSKIKDITVEIQGNTYIDGDLITNGTITGNMIKAGSFAIRNEEMKRDTFTINADGDVSLNGTLQSDSFNLLSGTGYRITPDGTAILNQARVSGEFVMPNAGVTNYGATIGNENIALKTNEGTTSWGWGLQSGGKTITEVVEDGVRCVKMVRDNVASTGWSYISYSNINRSKYKPKTKYTISMDVKSSVATQFYVSLREGNGTNPLTKEDVLIDKKTTPNSWVKVKATVTIVDSLPSSTTQCLYIGSANTGTGVSYIFRNLKIEEGAESTPWCPNKDEQFDYTRIWAGSNYNGRDTAPFRVTQNGDVWATNATLSGRLVGDYDNGKIHIHNNEIVINDTSTMMLPEGRIHNLTPLDASPNAHIILSSGQAQLNTDVVFGKSSDKRIEYSNNNRTLNLNNTTLSYSKGATSLMLDGGAWRGFKIGNNLGTDVAFGYENGGTWQGTTILSHSGVRGGFYKDINLRREDIKENLEVQLEGSLTVRTSIKAKDNKIEQRMTSDGWAWYSV